jgi:Tol biopolymer transport system component
MKKTSVCFLILIAGAAFLFAQNPKLKHTQILLDKPGTEAFYPRLSADGQTVFFTRANHQGLFALDRATGAVRTLSALPGAGYEFKLTPDGQSVVYRSFTYTNGRRFYSLFLQNIQTGKTSRLESGRRGLAAPLRTAGGSVLYYVDGRRKTAFSSSSAKKENDGAVFIRDRHLILLNASGETVLDPLGQGIYIWPSLSPEGKRIVFTVGGKGSYVCDLHGKVLADLGYVNAPVWSPDGKWIAGMRDFDDGVRITRSEVVLARADGTETFVLTQTPDRVELYPGWGNSAGELFFSDQKGVLYGAELELP